MAVCVCAMSWIWNYFLLWVNKNQSHNQFGIVNTKLFNHGISEQFEFGPWPSQLQYKTTTTATDTTTAKNTIENRWVCLTESITVLSFMFLYCVNLMPMYVWMYVSLKMWICLILCNVFLLAHKCNAHTGRLIALVRQWYLYLAVPHFVSLVF